MFNKKKKTIQTLKNNNAFLNKQNVDLRKSNLEYQVIIQKLKEDNKNIGNQCVILGEENANLKKEKKNLKRKLTMLEKEINNGGN